MQRENQRRKTIFNIQLLIPLRVAKFSFMYELILNTGKIQLDIDTNAKLSAVIISQSGSLSKWLVSVYLCWAYVSAVLLLNGWRRNYPKRKFA